ncbi:TLC domain-containing protein [Polychytrium aggregatum]|uniref:TLC domain-containing protein n=1 Tax=Polychytrium aggregatum TaxID=110093 RepID=UPI0022FEEB04|nr:TLC domain-containing protein [Polychytrium aggregatum]KAI9202816.1 TLC domain-containing protein [Polychytrium aggregatum]
METLSALLGPIYSAPLWPDFFSSIGLPRLAYHFTTLLTSAICCHAIFLVSFPISRTFFASYRALRGYSVINWPIHCVSMAFSTTILMLAAPMLLDQELRHDRVFGNNSYSGTVLAIACGYFLWDSLIVLSYVHEAGVGFVIHGFSCLLTYVTSFRPVLNFYGAVFLMFELSTPFLNVHWFCDKMNLSGSRIQWINGIVLLLTFFGGRIVFGLTMSYCFWVDMLAEWDRVPLVVSGIYCVSNIVLNILNIFWFHKMISAVRKRFIDDKPHKE